MSEGRGERTRAHILLAENDVDFRDALEFWLSEYGHAEIVTASDGKEAIEALDGTVDLFLCDQRMPHLTGPEALERMRPEGDGVPTIVISACEPNFEGHSAAVDRYLAKPIDRDELLDAVEQLLSE